MDTQQAKFILQSWRASGADAGDSHFADALRQLERDPELAEWFAREQALDSAIGRKLREVPVPAELAGTILAHRPIQEAARSRRRLAPLALAAALTVLATIAAIGLRSAKEGADFASYRDQMVQNLSGLRLDFAESRLIAVQQWLSTNRSVNGYHVPDGLQNLPSIGCKTWSWRGKPAALLCFALRDGRAVHLFVVPRSVVPDAPGGGEHRYAEREGWMTASWSEGGFVYVVARQGDETSLRQLLGNEAWRSAGSVIGWCAQLF